MKGRLSIDQLELTAVGTLSDRPARRVAADTSRAAAAHARSKKTEQLREHIRSVIAECARDEQMRGATADEVHVRTSATESERYDVRRLMEVRRRVSDLHAKFHEIRDTGIRRVNDAGNPMIVWEPGDGRE